MPGMIYRMLGKTGLQTSIIGFGASPLGNVFQDVTIEEAYRAVHYAIERCINFFDTSPYYGKTLSETRLGEALEGYREKIILATKAGRYDHSMETGFDFSYERVLRSAEESMQRLKTDYFDVLYLHDVEFRPKEQVMNEGLRALQKLKQDGKVRFIGVSGFPLPLLREYVETQELDLVLSYCHYNLVNHTLDEVLTSAVRAKGMGLVNASPLHMGLLTEGGIPEWHPAPQHVRDAVQKAAEICRQHGVDIAELALQFALQHKYVASTLVGMRTEQEVEQNLRFVGMSPDEKLLVDVMDILRPVQGYAWASGLPEYYEPGISSGG